MLTVLTSHVQVSHEQVSTYRNMITDPLTGHFDNTIFLLLIVTKLATLYDWQVSLDIGV